MNVEQRIRILERKLGIKESSIPTPIYNSNYVYFRTDRTFILKYIDKQFGYTAFNEKYDMFILTRNQFSQLENTLINTDPMYLRYPEKYIDVLYKNKGIQKWQSR